MICCLHNAVRLYLSVIPARLALGNLAKNSNLLNAAHKDGTGGKV